MKKKVADKKRIARQSKNDPINRPFEVKVTKNKRNIVGVKSKSGRFSGYTNSKLAVQVINRWYLTLVLILFLHAPSPQISYLIAILCCRKLCYFYPLPFTYMMYFSCYNHHFLRSCMMYKLTLANPAASTLWHRPRFVHLADYVYYLRSFKNNFISKRDGIVMPNYVIPMSDYLHESLTLEANTKAFV